MRATYKSPQTAVNASCYDVAFPPNWWVTRHHHTPICGHLYCFESSVEGNGESCLKELQILLILLQCEVHTAPAPANGLCYAHPQIPGVSRVVRLPLTSIYSQYFAGFQSCRGCKVFYYNLLKGSEVALHQKTAVLHARHDVKGSRYRDGNRFKVEQHLFGCTMWLQVVPTVCYFGLHYKTTFVNC